MSTKLGDGSFVLRSVWYYRAGRPLVRTALLGLILVLIVRAVEYLSYAARAIAFPFTLDYGEGIVWQQALLIPGSRMYGDITQFPYIVFHYTPLYHLTVRAIAAIFGADLLAAGRSSTLAFTIAIAVLAGSIVSAAMREILPTNARVVGGTISGLMLLTYSPVQDWAVMMRVDMLAVGFTMTGVYLAILAGERTIILSAAILMFVLAVYTKQTELAAPAAAMLVATMVSVRSSLKASAFGLVVGGGFFAILELKTGGRFWHHIFQYNLNRFSFHVMIRNLRTQEPEALGVLLGILAFAYLWWIEATSIAALRIRLWVDALRQSRKLRALMIISLWFVFASAQLVSVGKWGSTTNYFIEWICITTLPTGMVVSLAWERATTAHKAARFAGVAGVLVSFTLAAHALHRPLAELPIVDDPNGVAVRSQLVQLIRENPKPSLSEDMGLLLRAGQKVPIEPAIFDDLTARGIWNQQPFLSLIQARAFGLIILQEAEDEAFTSAVASAIRHNYPLVERRGDYTVRRPLEP